MKIVKIAVIAVVLLAMAGTVGFFAGKYIKQGIEQKRMALKAGDFEVKYENIVLKAGSPSKDMLDKLGEGKVSADDKADESGYKSKVHAYPAENPVIKVTVKNNEEKKDSYISLVDVSDYGTGRGVKKGGSYDDVVKAYGKPSQEESGKWLRYNHEKDAILFILNGEKKVESIFVGRMKE